MEARFADREDKLVKRMQAAFADRKEQLDTNMEAAFAEREEQLDKAMEKKFAEREAQLDRQMEAKMQRLADTQFAAVSVRLNHCAGPPTGRSSALAVLRSNSSLVANRLSRSLQVA